MRELYAAQLRTDSIFLAIPLTVFVTIIVSLVACIALSDSNGTFGFGMLILSVILSLGSARFAWNLIHDNKVRRGSLLFLGANLLILTLNYAQVSVATSFLAYMYGYFIVLSSTLLRPRYSFRVWWLSILCICIALAYRGNLSLVTLLEVMPAIIINLLLAVASFIATIDWETAVHVAVKAHVKAQRRRDELYEVQEDLKRTNMRGRYLYNQLETSMAVGQKVTAMLDLDMLLNQVAELIRKQLGFAYVAIFLLNDHDSQLTLRTFAIANETNSPESADKSILLEDKNVIGLSATEKQYQTVADIASPNYFTHPYTLHNVRSEAGFPLAMGGRLFGVMNIQSYAVNAFNEENLDMFQMLADQVAIAINNATLYRDQQIRYRLTHTMSEIQRAISGTLELDKVLNLILENLASIVSYNRAAVFLHRKNAIEMVASRGFPDEAQNIRVPLRDSEDVFLKIYHSKKPLSIPDVTQYSSWTAMETLPNARAWLGVPLMVDDEVMGMLSLAREVAKPYVEDDVELTNTFAAQAAVALQNARLYNRTKRFTQQLEYEVTQRTHALSEAYDQLEKMDKAKSDFIEVASHELRTPLTLLKGYSDMLRHDGKIQESDYHAQLVEGIYKGSIRMHEVVNDMLDVVKIDNQELNLLPEPVPLKTLLEFVSMKMEAAFVERQQHYQTEGVDSISPIEADPDALKKVFRHLLLNAVKYTPDGGTITLKARPYQPAHGRADIPIDYEGVHVTITDTGIGIDPANQQLIFTKFYQTGEVALHSTSKTKFKGGGPGLGLAIARGIVQAHKGYIWVESTGHDEETTPGSTFHVVLPLRQTRVPQPAT